MSRPPEDPGSPFTRGGELGRVMAGWDWAATPVGPPETWPAALRSVVRILLGSRFSMWMGSGPRSASWPLGLPDVAPREPWTVTVTTPAHGYAGWASGRAPRTGGDGDGNG